MKRFGLILSMSLTILAALAVQPATGGDWPMLAHDVGRSGSSPDDVPPPLERAWYRYFWTEGILANVQPVVVGQKLFVGTLAGKMYCIDTRTGQDEWVTPVGAAITHTACAGAGKVFFGAADGVVYALDAETGEIAWRHRTPHALWNAPLIFEGKVVIGGRDGVLRALNATDGSAAWEYSAGAPLLDSPALDPQRRRVYVTDEFMIAHAVNFDTGERVWRSSRPLSGVTCRGYHPVVAPDGTVMTRTLPYYSWDRARRPYDLACRTMFGTVEVGTDESQYPGTYTAMQDWRLGKPLNDKLRADQLKVMANDGYVERFEAELLKQMMADLPSQTLWLLHPDTGEQTTLAAVLYTSRCKSAMYPPVVTPGGKVVTKWLAAMTSRVDGYQKFVNAGVLDTTTGRVEPLFDETRPNSDNFGIIGDETNQWSCAGKWLYNSNQSWQYALDLSKPGSRGIRVVDRGFHTSGAGVLANVLRGTRVPLGHENLTSPFGVPDGPGEGSAASFADGALFCVTDDRVYCYRPSDTQYKVDTNPAVNRLTEKEMRQLYDGPVTWDDVVMPEERANAQDRAGHRWPSELKVPVGTLRDPDTKLAAEADAMPAEMLAAYVWQIPETTTLPDTATVRDLRARLTAAVEVFVGQPDWMPYRTQGGKHPVYGLRLFVDPTDTFIALSAAYPYLDESLQRQVKLYLRDQARRFQPLSSRTYAPDKGKPREPFAVTDLTQRFESSPARKAGIERLYAMWLWAENVGEWPALAAAWPSIEPMARPIAAANPVDVGNARCAGLIAYVRIAGRLGKPDTAAKAMPLATEAMRERLKYELAHHRGGVIGRRIELWDGYTRWTNLTPTLGRVIGDQAREVSRRIIEWQLDRMRPTWFVTWGPNMVGAAENSMDLPANSMWAFAAQAFIANRTGEQLAFWVDLPASKGDPYYIHKLTIALGACGENRWRDIRGKAE